MKKNILISKKQRELLLQSATIKQKEFSELLTHLNKNDTISFYDLKRYPHLENLTSYLDELIKSSSSEWFPSPTTPVFDLGPEYRKAKVVCELCGHKYLKLQYRIYNRILKKNMVIGSECIKEFGGGLENSFGSNIKDIQRAANKLFLEKEFPGIRKYIENKNVIHSYGMVVPKKFVIQWKQLREELRKSHSNYVSGKEKNLILLNSLWEEKQLLEEEIIKFIEDNKDKPFAVTGDLQKWLLRYQSEEFMNELQENNGFITLHNLHKVHEPLFMQYSLQNVSDELKNYGIKFRQVSPGTKRVDLEFQKNKKVLNGHLPYFILMKDIAGILFNSPTPDLSFNNILKKSTITSTSSLMNWMRLQLDSFGYSVVFENETEFVFSKSNNYYLATIKKTVDTYKVDFFKNSSNNRINTWIESLKQMDQKEYNIYRDLKRGLQFK